MFTFEPGVVLWTLVSFLLAFWVIQSYVYPPVRKLLDERREGIDRALKDSAEKMAHAEKVSAELQEKMRTVSLEEHRILSAARERAKILYNEQEKQLFAEFRTLRKQKEADLAKMEQEFFHNTEYQLAQLMVKACEKIIQNDLTPEQKNQIVAQRISELENLREI